MKITTPIAFLFSILAISCNQGKNIPDISSIHVDLPVERFEKDFYAMDSNNLEAGMPGLQQKYPALLPIFIQNIIGATDSNGIRSFLHLNRPVFEDVEKKFPNIDRVKSGIEEGLRFTKFYFPTYRVPAAIKTLVGPPDALAQMANGEQTPDFLGPDFIGISLQFYLGKEYKIYNDEYFITNVAPQYRSRRFEKEYIPADVMKLIADDVYPDRSSGKPLITQIIEKGKQWYLLDHLMPRTADTLKTGYTKKQLDWCDKYEGLIWNKIIAEDLYTVEPVTIQTYIGEAPFTQTLGNDSPGNLGQWVGWQIVKKFASGNPEMTLADILKTPTEKMLEGAKYKPK